MRFPFAALPVKLWGDSYVVIIPRWMRESLHIEPGDIIACRIHEPYCTFCVWPKPAMVQNDQILNEALPPRTPAELHAQIRKA